MSLPIAHARAHAHARTVPRVRAVSRAVSRAAAATPTRAARVCAATAPDADADARADPWLDARRAELAALTVDKGLKPLCRGYGLKLGGSKTTLLERVLEYESANRAEFAPMEAVVKQASSWRNARIVHVETAETAGDGRDRREKAAKKNAAGGWGRDEEDDFGEEWGSEWDRNDVDGDDIEASTAYLMDIEARYPALRLASESLSRDDLARRIAVVNGLRQLAKEKKGYEADTALHLEAIARAVEKSYRDMRGSALTILQKEARRRVDVSVDIDVARGRFAVLVQVIGRSGAVEREYDDTKFFNFNIRRQNRMRPLIGYLSDEVKNGVARRATEDFVEKVGSVCEGAVRFRSEDGAWMVDIDGGAAGVIPPQEQLQALQLVQGDRVTCFVLDVENNLFTGRERTPVILSMTIPGVVAGIIEMEVPEVARGDVVIKAISRIPGRMTKVAVTVAEDCHTVWSAIDACVGPDNERLRRIRDRAGGEIVHFIQWSEDPEEVVKAALFPAEVKKTEYSFPAGERLPKIVAYVSAFDSSRAIGAGGANVKLAAALTNTFVVIEKIESDGDDMRRRSSFNDDLDDAFDNGSFWGRDEKDAGFDSRDAEEFTNILSENRYNEKQSQGVVLDDLGWPDLPEFDSLKVSAEDDDDAPVTAAVNELKSLSEMLGEDDDDDDDAFDGGDEEDTWEVGPGRPGLVTFGATGRPGLVGAAVFFGDVDSYEYDDDVIFD